MTLYSQEALDAAAAEVSRQQHGGPPDPDDIRFASDVLGAAFVTLPAVTWELIGWAGVDSGRLMLADPCYACQMPAEFLASSCTEDGTAAWSPHGLDIAMMVATQGGDGLFPVRVLRDDEGRVIAVRADFTREARTAAEQE
jgi:hypothetical protein